MPRIHANRDTVDDRFSVLGFTIRTESPLYEVAVATDPALFRADARPRRSRRNFFSSRAQGALRARRGEAIYLLPQDVLSNFVGQPRLYFGLATYREGTTTQPDFVQAPTEGHMYVSTSGLTERGLRRAVSALAPSSYGQVNGRDPSLEWGGDSQEAPRANGGTAARPAPTAAAPAPATPVAAALMDYDDGFGAFPVAEEPPPAQREPEPAAPAYGSEPRLASAQEIIASFNGDLGSQIEWFFGTVAFVAGVNDTRQIPHSAICQVLCYNGDRHIGSATAFYIGRRLLLTNAHVVNGCTRMIVIPGKNGAGTSRAEEPYGRFTVTQWRAHERYSAGSRDFDMAIVHATQDAPNGQWLSPVEELRQSRPEGVAVCGYSARSRRDDTTGRIVNATLNPDKQHAHRGYVRDIGNDVMHYDVHELAGSSGSPVYWIERGLRPRVHVVGVNAGPRDATTNSGCRITDAKVAWIRARAAEWGESNAMEAPEEPANVIPVDPSQQPAMSDAQEVMLRSYDGTLESQLRLFGESIGWIAGVPSTRGFPHSAICFVADVASGPEVERGTAFFVGRNLLVTAAHVVQGKSRLGFVPGKNGQGTDAAHEPFGRFEVNSADWVQHPQYRTRGDAFDIAIIRTPGAAPGGHWFNRLEELRESRPEGVAVCGYSALSRRSGWIPALVNAINDSRKQHLHRGYVRELPGDENFTYDVQTLPGASGSPVFWVEAGSPPRVHAVGVHIAGSDDRTNLGCRFTDAKVAWLRRQATAWGQPRAFELGQAADGNGNARQPQLAPPPAPQIQQPLGLDEALAVPAAAVEIASVIAGAAMERISSNQGDISWQLDQLRGMKHPNDQAPARPAPFQDGPAIRLTEWPKVTNYLGDEISAGFEIRWQYNGQSLGNVQVSNIRTNDAVGWGLSVIVRIMDDNIVYPRNQPTFAALRVRLDYTFTRSLGSDVLAHQIVHLFGNGRHNIAHEWTQSSTFALDAEPEQEDERLLNARIPAGADAQALEFTARIVAPTPPSAALRAAIGAASGQRRALLEAATRELGVREEPNPAYPGQGDPTINSDREGRIVMYLRESGVSATQGQANPAYCAAFVTVMMRQAGYRGVPGSASARRLREQFEQASRFRPVDQTRPYDPRQDFRPQAGDLYFKGRPGAETHVGIVVSVDDDGTLHTIEGNTWGAGGEAQSGVMERSIRSSHGHVRANTVGFGVLL